MPWPANLRWFLFSLAFIAVYREVFETILFFTAMAAEGAVANLIAGAIAGFAALAAIAVAMLRFSRRLPIGKFFYLQLGIGRGARDRSRRQGRGRAPGGRPDRHPPACRVPANSVLGLFPTLQGMLAQVATLLALLIGFARTAALRGARRPPNLLARDGALDYSCSQEEESEMAGVNKVILVGNLGADPEARSLTTAARSSTCESRRRRIGATKRPESARKRPSGIESRSSTRTSARSPRITSARAARSISKASCKPANGPTRRVRSAIRPKSSFRITAVSCSCSTAAKAAAAQAAAPSTRISGATISAAARRQRPSRGRSRRRSTPIWTMTFPSRIAGPCSSALRRLASTANGLD